MEGTVLHFDASSKTGIIRGTNGSRYEFQQSDWKSESIPSSGMRADFVITGINAAQIYELPPDKLASDNADSEKRVTLKWPDITESITDSQIAANVMKTEDKTTTKPENSSSSSGRKMNLIGMLATVAGALTLFSPVFYSGHYGYFSPFLWAEKLHLWMVPLLFAVAVIFYNGGSRKLIRALSLISIGGIALGYYNGFQEYSIVVWGEPRPVSLAFGAYLNFSALFIMTAAAFSKHYSPYGFISSSTRVVEGCIDTTGSYSQTYGGRWFRYNYLSFLGADGKKVQAKRVLVPDQIDPLVVPNMCGTFIFTTQFFQRVLIGIKTDDNEAWYLPSSVEGEILKYIFAALFCGFMTFGTFATIILMPFTPLFAIATVAAAFGVFNAPFRISRMKKDLIENGFTLAKVKNI